MKFNKPTMKVRWFDRRALSPQRLRLYYSYLNIYIYHIMYTLKIYKITWKC